MRKLSFFLLSVILFTITANAQLTGVKTIPGDYPSIAAAVSALNSQGVGAGGVTFNVAAAYTETAPTGGINLTATGTAANPIVFQKSGAGANPLINAPVGTVTLTTTSASVDGIFSFSGSDYVTIDGIDLLDNNASGAAMMEYGYGFFKASATDGCQNNTIKNCLITLNKANNVDGTTNTFGAGSKAIFLGNVTIAAMATDLVISTASGRSNNNSFTGNTIKNCLSGIYIRGYGDAVSPYANLDQNNSVGGNSGALGNSITNYGTGTLAAWGIQTFNQNNLLVQNNSVNNTANGGTTGSGLIGGILVSGSNVTNNSSYNILTNTLTLAQGNNTAQIQGINVGTAGGTGTVNISNNIITGFTNASTVTPGAMFGTVVSNSAGATVNITDNTYSNNQVAGIVNMISLQASATAATANITGNNFTNTTISTNAAGTTIMIANGAAVTGALNINNNTVDGVTYSVANTNSSAYIFSSTLGASCVFTETGNTVKNINYPAATTATTYLLYNAHLGGSETISNNILNNLNLNTTGTVYCIYASNSTPTVNISGNQVNNYTRPTTSGSTYCIYNLGAPGSGTSTVTNNSFTNFSVNGTNSVYGIYYSTVSTHSHSISGNTISGWNSNGGAGQMYGIYCPTGFTNNIFNNSISNITNAYNGTNYCVYAYGGNSGTGNVYGNTVTGWTNGGSTLYGLYITMGAPTAVNVYKNKIADLTSNGTGAAYGIYVSTASVVNIYNNLIGNISTPATTNANGAVGLYIAGGTTVNAHYNTIYLTGTSTGTNFGSSGIYNSTTPTTTLINNLVINKSTPTGTGLAVAYRRSSTTLTSFGASSNNNLWYAGTPSSSRLIYYDGTNSDQTLAAYKTRVAPRDASAVTEDVAFLSTTGTSSNFLHIDPAVATLVESGGTPVSGITDDYDGQTRSAAPDIGADEGTFTPSPTETNPPGISYTPIAGSCNTGNITLTATIGDASGVPTSGTLVPRIYYKKNNGSYFSQPGSFVSGTATNGVWNFTIVAADMGGVAAGDIVSYYVIAQDIAATPNIGSNPSGVVATNVNTVTTPPGNPNFYAIGITSGTFTVGSGGNFSTLTQAVASYNAGCITGPIVFNLIDATYPSETFPITINAVAGASSTNTLTIKPASGNTASLTGSLASGALIRFNGADYVTIDGSNNGSNSRNLTITNSNVTAPTTISLQSLGAGAGATNITIKNCNISTGVATSVGYGIAVGGTSPGTGGSDNDNVTLQNNSITNAPIAIYANGTAAVSAGGDDNLSILDNVIDYNSTLASIGIEVGNALNSLINNNTVAEQTSSFQAPTAISIETGFVSSSITKNNITKSLTTNTGGYGGRGLTVGTGTASSNLTIANNFVSGINGSNWSSYSNSSSMGIAIGVIGNSSTLTTTAGGINLYFNSVNMYGTYTAATTNCITTALYIGSGASALNVRDNIFTNSMSTTGSGAKAYAIYSAAANTAFTNINYNDYYAQAPQGVLGFLGSDQTTLAAIQTAFGGNANSINIQPLFVSNTDLHLNVNANGFLDNKGTPIAGITDDIDGNARSATTPDVGADEFTAIVCNGAVAGTASITPTSAICNSGTVNLNLAGFTTTSGIAFQWQSSPTGSPGSFVNISGATNFSYTGTITSTTYFRAYVVCLFGGASDTSNVVSASVTQTSITSTTPGTRCGIGTVNLSATGSTGTTVNWYASASGGSPIGTGNNFTTPVISSTTNFYAAATNGIGNIAGLGSTVVPTASGYNAQRGIQFNATQAFTLVSAQVYYGYAGTTNVTVQLRDNADVVLQTVTLNIVTSDATPDWHTMTLNFPVPVGTGFKLLAQFNSGSLSNYSHPTGVDYSSPTWNNLSPVGIITNGLDFGPVVSTTSYWYFYNIVVSSGCESSRVPVAATVTPPPALTLSPGSTANICTGQSITIGASSTNAGYNYVWNPGNLAGAVQTVTPAATQKYIVTATDNSGGPNNNCVNKDSITVTVNPYPSPATIAPVSPQICNGTIQQLTASGGTIQGTATIGTGTVQNTTTDVSIMPPYGNWYTGNRHQMLVLASELTAAGFTAGTQISSLAFDVVSNTNALGYNGFTIKLGNTTATSLTTTFLTTPTTQVYTIANFNPTVGWSNHVFQTPFTWDGTSNLLVETYFSNCGAANCSGTTCSVTGSGITYTQNAITRQTVVGFTSHIFYYSDVAGCNPQNQTTATVSTTTRPNMQFGITTAVVSKWTPSADLYTNAAGTIPYTGTSVSVVYAKPTASRTYTFTSANVGCAVNASVNVKVDQIPALTITPNSSTICNGQIQSLAANSNGTAAITTASSGAITIAVPDNNPAGAIHTIAVNGVPANAVIANIAVTLNMTHSSDGNMIFNLKAPNGNILNLINQGGSGQNFANTSIASHTGLTAISTGTAPFTNTFTPSAAAVGPTGYTANVFNFTGLFSQPNGNWTLAMQDAVAGNTGTLTSWSITIYYYVPDNYLWSPALELYTNSGATTPYAGTNLATVYAKPTVTRTYTVAASTPGGCNSNANVTITVNQLPAISNQPVSISVCPNETATFNVGATGTGISYQWFQGATALTNGGNISGATSSTLVITNVTVANAGNYSVVITGVCTPPATSNTVVLGVGSSPVITSQPQNQIVCAGNTATFSVTTNSQNVTYQWYKNGVALVSGGNIIGATSPILTILNVSAADAGTYTVVITNTCAAPTTSAGGVLTFSASDRWLGVANSDWNNPNNWCNGVPTPNTDVVILSTAPFQPILAANGDVRNLQIDAGASMTVTGSGWLNIWGNTLTQNGTFNTTLGTISFRNTANLNLPAMTMANLIMNGSGGITMNGNLRVDTALTLTNGNITLGNNSLTMKGGTLGSANSHIVTNGIGVVTNNNVGVATVVFPVGPTATTYDPLQIASGQGLNYSVRVASGVPGTVFNATKTINRTWTISSNNPPASPVQLTFNYADAEGNSGYSPAVNMEVGYFNGTTWVVTTPTGGTPATGTPAARQVYTTTSNLGTMVVSNVGGLLNIVTGTPNLNTDIFSVKLLPNLVNNQSTLRVNSRRAMNVEWSIMDLQGKHVMKFTHPILAGQNDINLKLGHLASGSYQLVGYTEKGTTGVVQFVKY